MTDKKDDKASPKKTMKQLLEEKAQRQPAVTPAERLYRIVEDGMCIGCGLCEAIAGHDTVQIKTVQTGYLRPVVTGDLDQETVDRIYDVCPGLRLDSLPERLIEKETIIDPIWGPYISMMRAHATDAKTRLKAASGGVLTALTQFMLDQGKVSFILQARPSDVDATFGVPQISETRDMAAQATGSIYGPTPVLQHLDAALSRDKPFAFVGKPCDISALRNLARFDPRVDRLVKFWMTPVCGGIVPLASMDRFLDSKGITRTDLTSFKYRGDGCPGEVEYETRDGKQGRANMYEPYGGFDENSWQLPFRCKVCPDGPGEGADIVAGDIWEGGEIDWENAKTDKGSNAIIVRTLVGETLVKEAISAGYLTIEHNITPRWYDACQPHQVVKKHFTRARWDGMLAEGRIVPRTQGLRLDEHARNAGATSYETQKNGTIRRLRGGLEDEPTPNAFRALSEET